MNNNFVAACLKRRSHIAHVSITGGTGCFPIRIPLSWHGYVRDKVRVVGAEPSRVVIRSGWTIAVDDDASSFLQYLVDEMGFFPLPISRPRDDGTSVHR